MSLFELTVLHDITDNAELIEVATTALSAERLLKCDLRIELDLLSISSDIQ